MYAVLIEVDADQGLRALREHMVPSIKAMPGFRSGTWLPGNEDTRACRSRFGIPTRTLRSWQTASDLARARRRTHRSYAARSGR
jgi:hypothetical protein